MSTYTSYRYEYTCDECKKEVSNTLSHHSCSNCSINLCNDCYMRRNSHICAWCFHKIPNKLLWKRKFTWFAMFVAPILLFLIPSPLPAFFLFDDIEGLSGISLLITFLIAGLYLIIFGYMQFNNKKQILKAISSDSNDDKDDIDKSDLNKEEEDFKPLSYSEKLKKVSDLFDMSKSVRIDTVTKLLDMNKEKLIEFLIENQEELGEIKVEEEFIKIITTSDLNEFTNLLDEQFETWEHREETKQGKKT